MPRSPLWGDPGRHKYAFILSYLLFMYKKILVLKDAQIKALRYALAAAVQDGVTGPFGDGEEWYDEKGYRAICEVKNIIG